MTRTILRRAALAGAAVTTAFLLAACGFSSGEHSSMPMSHGASSQAVSASAATFNNADVMFAQMMIPHHQQAVEMATLAETRASDPQVKQLAEQIKAAQAPEIATMTGWLTAWGKPTVAPGGMPGMTASAMPGMTASAMPGMDHSAHGGMPGIISEADMAKLKAASGKDFDRQFLQMMIAHHQGAIDMAKQEQTAGANPDAKALAGRIITTQQAEISTMNAILARL